MMILHHGWRSSASRRVRLCLEEKGLAYEGHVVDMARMEHHSPEYLKINPLGVIPTLIHDGKPLHESGTICEYLDETFPASPLRPDTPYERAEMRNWIRHIDGLIGNLIISTGGTICRRPPRNGPTGSLPTSSRASRARSARRPGSASRANPTPRKSATPRGPNWSCCWTKWKRRSSRQAGWSAGPIR
jgi:glutathione S-transferase